MQGKNRESYLEKKRDELMAENSILKDSITGYEISCSNLRTKLDYKVKECEDFEEALQSKNKAIWEYLEIIKKKDAEISKLKEDNSRISYNLEAVLSERKEDEVDDPLSNGFLSQFKVLTQKNQKLTSENNQLRQERDKLRINFDALAESVEKEHKAKEDFSKMISEIKQNELTIGTGEVIGYRIGFTEEKPPHVYSVRSDQAKAFVLFRDAADAFKDRDERNKNEKMCHGGQHIFWKVELEEIR